MDAPKKKKKNGNLRILCLTSNGISRIDARKLEEWARAQNPTSLVEFSSRDGEVEAILKDIAERAGQRRDSSYSRFFAEGLFRLLELTNATEPTILEKVGFIQCIML